MKMDGSRRSIDRSREPGMKKPRLDEGVGRDRSSNGIIDRDRPFPQRVSAGASPATGPPVSKFRTNERERNAEKHDPVIHQHQELVSRYKTALAELTFNSKPIITNLTIIAGENLHAAKWITATVCENILEVPSEQKLPSLYLLDSIVKNIGRDYIKYFATKLPEVFCKAYRQVDSSIHSGMRHLFGTWKGVFPPASLQMIEKELGFPPAINGSSSGATMSRPDSQSQRPPHSIHVNPKYLEARQRLQQPSRDTRLPQREASSEPVHEKKSSAGYEDFEYGSDLSRHSDLVIGRASERANERDGDKPLYGSGSNAADATIGQRKVFDKQDGFSKYRAPKSAQVLTQLQPTRSIGNRSSRGMNENWKNSEEEEYIWDEMNSRLTDHGGPDSSSIDGWTPDDAEKVEFEDHLPHAHGEHDIGSKINRETSSDPLSITQRGQAAFGHQASSMWPSQAQQSVDDLKHISITSRSSGHSEHNPSSYNGLSTSMNSSLGRTGFQTLMGPSVGSTPSFGALVNKVSGSGVFLGQQRHQPLRPPSPSGQLPMHQLPLSPSSSVLRQHQEFLSFTEKDHLQTQSSQPGQKTSQLAGLLKAPHIQITQDSSFTIRPQNHIQSGTWKNLQSIQSQSPQHIQASSIQMPFPQRRHHSPFSQPLHPEPTQSQPAGQTQKPLPQHSLSRSPPIMGHSASGHSNIIGADAQGQSNTDSLLAKIMKSGLLSNNSITGGFPNLGLKDSGVLPSHLSVQPPMPSGHLTQLAASSAPMVAPAPVLGSASHSSTSSLTTHPHRTTLLPPLPPGPPPALSFISTTSSETTNVASAVEKPLANLLSTLVAKGLISSPAKEVPTLNSPQVPGRLQNQSLGPAACSSMPVSSMASSSTIPTSSGNDLPFEGSAAKSTTTLSPPMMIERKDIIGIEFKPEIIRESHPSVISDLYDDLPHQCSICGHRLKFQEQLDLHLEWHASKNPGTNSSKRLSRRWYSSLGAWVAGSEESSFTPKSTSVEGLVETAEKSKPVVPADESQCVCVLCGEPFEDFYSHERDEWMYKGAAYMSMPAVDGDIGTTDESAAWGPIVHTNCVSPTSVYDLGLAKNVKLEQTDG